MTAALTTIATAATTATATATTIELSAADALGGLIAMTVALLSFLSISGLALQMTIGASKSPGTMAITGTAALLSVLVAVGLYMSLSTTHHGPLEACGGKMWDFIGGSIAMVMGTVGLLTIGGLMVTMSIGAFSPSKQPMSSWPAEQEQAFYGFNQRATQSQSRAWTFSVAAAVVTFLFIVGVYQGVKPDIKDLSKDMNMSNLTKKSAKSEAAPTSKAEQPKAEQPKAEQPKAEEPKAEEPKAKE